ncbi:MAG: TrkA family potassium uptake protein [Clostridiales bacterium]|nr:TrkA family potassium uptake protein [Clostridiales bacterium]
MKQFAIIGIGRFGASIARTLFSLGHDVLVIDAQEESIEEISEYVTHAVIADATDEQTLIALGVRNFDVAVVTIGGDIQASILVCLLCKEMGIKTVIAKAQNELHARVLRKIGVDRVVFPERDMGMRLAHNLVSSNVLDFIELSNDHSLVEISVHDAWTGSSLKDLDMRVKFGVNVMAIKHGGIINISPRGEDIIESGDTLVVIGANEDIRKLEKRAE